MGQNEIYDVYIEKDGGNGEGLCYIDDTVVFVGGTTAGDRAKIKIISRKPNYMRAVAEEIIMPSENRREDFCELSKACGGCDIAHIKYERQLQIKSEHVRDCLERIGRCDMEGLEFFDICAMEHPQGYRNKMVFPVGKSGEKTVGGFYKRRSHEIIPLKECKQGHSVCTKYLRSVISYMNENNVSAYDEKTSKGAVRRVFVRLGKATHEAMVVVSATQKKLPHIEKLIEKLTKTKDDEYNLVSIILNINREKNNLVLGNENITLWGRDTIKDIICGVKFDISPNSFFQINPTQTEVLYKKAIEFAGLSGKERVLDLYCGAGTISLIAAKSSRSVTGVEIVEDAVRDAQKNAAANGIKNVRFIAGDAQVAAQKAAEEKEKFDVVFLDPPRKGSDSKTLNSIINIAPEKIVYISCNPATLARDAAFLKENGYLLRKVQPVDMFPNTTHVETVVLLSQRKPDDRVKVKIDLDELDITTAESKATYEEIKAYVLNKYHFKVSSLYIAQIKTKYGIKEAINYNISKKGTRVPQCPPDKENAITDALKYYGMI